MASAIQSSTIGTQRRAQQGGAVGLLGAAQRGLVGGKDVVDAGREVVVDGVDQSLGSAKEKGRGKGGDRGHSHQRRQGLGGEDGA